MSWSPSELKFLKSLSTPEKIQSYLDSLTYNTHDSALSPRYVMITQEAHCFEGGLLAAAALELQGHKPMMVDLIAHNDDHHVITVYKTKTGWGSISKSSTTLIRSRLPHYKDIRELVMSYFDFYFNKKGRLSLYSYAGPLNLNHYNDWNWRTSEKNLMRLGMDFTDLVHYELITLPQLKKLPKVSKALWEASYLEVIKHNTYKL